MDVRWSYEGLHFSHTAAESPDPDDHLEQPITPDELIFHAANLHLFRTERNAQNPRVLWSLRTPLPENREFG